MRTTSIPVAFFILTLASTATATSGQRACRSGFEVAGTASIVGGGRVIQVSSDATCNFEVRLCVNIGAPTCRERPLARMTVRGAAVVAGLEPPTHLEEAGSCGPWARVTLFQPGQRSSGKRLRVGIREKGGRRSAARLSLVCVPPAQNVMPPPPGMRACEGIPMPPRIPGRLIDFPPSLPLGSCAEGGVSSNYATPSALVPQATAELHVIGVNGAPRPADSEPGHGLAPAPVRPSIVVNIHPRPKPIVLFLSAYQAVSWELLVDPTATLKRVIVQGYERQQVNGVPHGVSVTQLGRDEILGLFYGWELGAGGAEYVRAIEGIRRYTGLVESSFQGCYAGASFEIPHWQGEPEFCQESAVSGDETIPRRSVPFAGCESVTTESQYCLTIAGGSLALLGIDSGAVCPVATDARLEHTPTDHALSWRGEVAYVCDDYAGLKRISLKDGKTGLAQMPCSGVGVDGGRLLVAAPSGRTDEPWARSLFGFDTWEQLLAGRTISSFDLGYFVSRMTVHDGILYTAWHSTDTIKRTSLATGEALPPVALEGYEGWILGLAVTGDGRLLVTGELGGDTVYVFDARTGKAEGVVRPSTPVAGLACVDRR